MTCVSIMVPHGSVLPNSLLGLFKVFTLANHYSAEDGRGAACELHLVGNSATASLYGGQFAVEVDQLAEVGATDVAILPAMAGNIADAVKDNSAFVPWLQNQYRAGAEIAGLCTGACFIVEADLLHEKDCSSNWFVDETFRKQYSQLSLLAEKSAPTTESIQTDSGAWLFIQKLLERAAGYKTAVACSASFQEPFNRECQSVVSVSDPEGQCPSRIAEREWRSPDSESMYDMSVERFLSRFHVNPGQREDSLSIAALFDEALQTQVESTRLEASCALSGQKERGSAAIHNTRAFKALFRRIERAETNCGNG